MQAYPSNAVYTLAAGTVDVEAVVAKPPAGILLLLTGYSIRESASSAAVATLLLLNGATVAAGVLVAPIELAANGLDKFVFPDGGIECPAGITVDRVAGESQGAIYYRYQA